MRRAFGILFLAGWVAGCSARSSSETVTESDRTINLEMSSSNDDTAAASKRIATFAGGCFWCVEKPFEKLDGVSAVISGYTGGKEENPTYRQVSGGTTGHTEAIQVHTGYMRWQSYQGVQKWKMTFRSTWNGS